MQIYISRSLSYYYLCFVYMQVHIAVLKVDHLLDIEHLYMNKKKTFFKHSRSLNKRDFKFDYIFK